MRSKWRLRIYGSCGSSLRRAVRWIIIQSSKIRWWILPRFLSMRCGGASQAWFARWGRPRPRQDRRKHSRRSITTIRFKLRKSRAQAGAQSFALCSSLGADAASRFTYLRTKGQLEDDLCKVGFPSVTIIRPGFIEGERSDRRPFQRLTAEILRRLRPILPRQYRLSPAPVIARLLIDGAVAGLPGRHIVEAGDIADRLR